MRPIIVMSKGCVERMHTMRWLDELGFAYTVVTHTEEQAQSVKAACAGSVLVTGCKHLVENRNVAFSLVQEGEWFVGMDDNILRLTQVRDDFYSGDVIDQEVAPPKPAKTWRDVYRIGASWRLEALVEELIAKCEEYGTIYGGFASMENPFFRQRKWSSVRFVKSKLFVMKRTAGVWWESEYAHDSLMSAYVVAHFGKVAVNNWVHPEHKMYEAGGLGHVSARRRNGLDDSLELACAMYPGLVAHAKRGKNTALRFLLTNPESVNRWRVERGFV